MAPILPSNVRGIHQSQVHLVDQRRGLQGDARSLVCDMVAGTPPEFLVNQRHQANERVFVPAAPSPQQPRDRYCFRPFHSST